MKKLPQQTIENAKTYEDQRKTIKELQDINKKKENKILCYENRVKELEEHIKDLSGILEEWCTRVICK